MKGQHRSDPDSLPVRLILAAALVVGMLVGIGLVFVTLAVVGL